jgi:pimeloyl-ACP methyl ester carboxylesterase
MALIASANWFSRVTLNRLLRRGCPLMAVLCGVLCAYAGAASAGSLYSGRGHRPGPDILYAGRATVPQLENTGVWKAKPILVSGATAYRHGEFLYQDWLYDDHGAKEMADQNDPAAGGNLFSKPNGTYDYPSGPGYDDNAADLVEFRVKPLSDATAFRITLNTLANPSLIAFSIALGGTPGQPHAFPFGANVVAPADLFLTVHPASGALVGELDNATTGLPVPGAGPQVHVDAVRRQIEVDVPHAAWDPGTGIVRLAMGVGLWDSTTNMYLLPELSRSQTAPGGSGFDPRPAAFFNVAFRMHEPVQPVLPPSAVVTNPAWWRDSEQGAALANHDISDLYVNVDFNKLEHRLTDNSGIPTTGVIDRILPSHFNLGQGADFSNECGLNGVTNPSSCHPEYLGQLQPYQLYVPTTHTPRGGFGLTLLLHSLSTNYNQFIGSRNQSQMANRGLPSLVLTPEARGPDQSYEGYGAADVFEAWADVARLYKLNPSYAAVTGYSMGGFGSFKLAAQFPDLFARIQPVVGAESNDDVLASLRNIPVLMWNTHGDELANEADFQTTAAKLQSLGYRYELDAFQPCAAAPMPQNCSPLFPNHLALAVNDQFAPAAAFLGTARVNYNPPHVTYVVEGERNRPNVGVVGDHAYWLSGLTLRSNSHTASNGDPEGEIDALSHGLGVGDPTASGLQPGSGTLTGGNLGDLIFTRQFQTWGSTPRAAKANVIDITATNIATVTIDARRARVSCRVKLNIQSDGPLKVKLADCPRAHRRHHRRHHHRRGHHRHRVRRTDSVST